LLTCGRLVIGLAFRATKERPITNATRLFGFKLLLKLRAMERSCPRRDQLNVRGLCQNASRSGVRFLEDQPAARRARSHAPELHRYIQWTQIEATFKCLKSDLSIRPLYHQPERRVDAYYYILVAYPAYWLIVTLKHRLGAAERATPPSSRCS
jgi:hypothetical protein